MSSAVAVSRSAPFFRKPNNNLEIHAKSNRASATTAYKQGRTSVPQGQMQDQCGSTRAGLRPEQPCHRPQETDKTWHGNHDGNGGTHRNAESGTSTPDLTQSMAQTSHFGGDQLPWCRLDLKRMDTHITRCSVSQNLCSHTACIAGAERESGHKRTPASRM